MMSCHAHFARHKTSSGRTRARASSCMPSCISRLETGLESGDAKPAALQLGHRNGPSLKGPSASVIKWVDSPRERQWATPQKSRHALGQSDAGPPGIGHERGQRFQRGGVSKLQSAAPEPQMSSHCQPIRRTLGTELSRLRKSLQY